MATSRSQDNSKLFITIQERSRDRLNNKDLEYSLSCIFRTLTTDPKTNCEILVYERKISSQANALNDGLQLHLFTLASTTYGYRLSVEATDNNQIEFISCFYCFIVRWNDKGEQSTSLKHNHPQN
ncbi:unnamed protein product [Rotaria sp. Silwood1]|nr:unnamed protein product [Rotaria sp. Silwood1]